VVGLIAVKAASNLPARKSLRGGRRNKVNRNALWGWVQGRPAVVVAAGGFGAARKVLSGLRRTCEFLLGLQPVADGVGLPRQVRQAKGPRNHAQHMALDGLGVRKGHLLKEKWMRTDQAEK
jgi:hypothetical protein